MPKPLKLRRVNEIVGLFIILSIALVLAVSLLGPRTRRWFTPSRRIAVQLPPEGSLGLRKGGDVLIMGSVVGSVEDLSVNENGEMVAELDIRGNFIRFVRTDSTAIIRKPLGIGEPFVEITRGHGTPFPLSGASLSSVADKAPTELIQETISAFRNEALPAVKEMRDAVSQYTQLAVEVRSQQKAIQEALGHVNRVGDLLEHGNGVASLILTDPKPAAELREAIPKLSGSLKDLQTTLAQARSIADRVSAMADTITPASKRVPTIAADLQEVTAGLRSATTDLQRAAHSLPQLEKSTQQAVDAVPGLLLQVQETSRQIQRLAEALQRNWMVRGNMQQETPAAGRISPDRVGAE